MGDRDSNGRFRRGNTAAKRRQRVLSTYQLAQLVNRTLTELGEDRTLEDFLAELVCRLVQRATKGDEAAARWLIDRFAPPEKDPRVSIGRLPKPSEDPLGFVDKVAAAVTQGKMSVGDASRLGRLVSPMIVDETLRGMVRELEELKAEMRELTGTRLQVVK